VKEFLRFVIGQLISRPEELVLREETRGSVLCFLLELPRSEVGKVIGKQGHTIRAIRNLLASVAARHGQRVMLDIVERED
jgi:predicted RNA-binding protein YlqC (UPF0109 family)